MSIVKQTPVRLIPSENKSRITKNNLGTLSLSKTPQHMVVNTNQYLCFTSSDEIKVGDWITGTELNWGIYNEIHQVKVIKNLESGKLFWFNDECNGISAIPEQCTKIIAISDTSFDGGIQKGKIYNILSEGTKYEPFNIPQPPIDFIKKYMKSYNRGEIYTHVLVEYERDVEMRQGYTKPSAANRSTEWYYDRHISHKLKINPKDNTITIKELKQSWSREDLEVLKYEYEAAKGHSRVNDKREECVQRIFNWISENL